MVTEALCPECGNRDFVSDYKRGEIVCCDCGLVLQQHAIELGQERRMFDSDDLSKKSQVGSPSNITVHDRGLSTIIGGYSKDAHGKMLNPTQRRQAKELIRGQTRSRTMRSIDKNLSTAMSELDRIASQLRLPRGVKDTAAYIYRKVADKNLVRGRSIQAMLVAAIYVSCRYNKVPKTLVDFTKVSDLDRTKISQCYRFIVKNLKLNNFVITPSPRSFIPVLISELSLSNNTQQEAYSILDQANKSFTVVGKAPTSIASAALYIASYRTKERRTQKEIAKVFNLTEATLRNRMKDIMNILGIEELK